MAARSPIVLLYDHQHILPLLEAIWLFWSRARRPQRQICGHPIGTQQRYYDSNNFDGVKISIGKELDLDLNRKQF